jgi:hypothetical protein
MNNPNPEQFRPQNSGQDLYEFGKQLIPDGTEPDEVAIGGDKVWRRRLITPEGEWLYERALHEEIGDEPAMLVFLPLDDRIPQESVSIDVAAYRAKERGEIVLPEDLTPKPNPLLSQEPKSPQRKLAELLLGPSDLDLMYAEATLIDMMYGINKFPLSDWQRYKKLKHN